MLLEYIGRFELALTQNASEFFPVEKIGDIERLGRRLDRHRFTRAGRI